MARTPAHSLLYMAPTSLPQKISRRFAGYFNQPISGVAHDFVLDAYLYLYNASLIDPGHFMDDNPPFEWNGFLELEIRLRTAGADLIQVAHTLRTAGMTMSKDAFKSHKRYVCHQIPIGMVREVSEHFLPFYAVLALLVGVQPSSAQSAGSFLSANCETWIPIQIGNDLRILQVRFSPADSDSQWVVEFADLDKVSAIPCGKAVLFRS
jgi:hypothetical protein